MTIKNFFHNFNKVEEFLPAGPQGEPEQSEWEHPWEAEQEEPEQLV